MNSHKNPIASRAARRVQVALPLRVTYYDAGNKPCLSMSCSYDIAERGARISALRHGLKAGDIVAVDRGRTKVFCRVVWIGGAGTPRAGQVGIECTDPAKSMWENELKQFEEIYDALPRVNGIGKGLQPGTNERERRRFHRTVAEGWADLTEGEETHTIADLQDLSEYGCRLVSRHSLAPGMSLDLSINVAHYDLKFKGQVRNSVDLALGIEFREARKGDMQMLQHLVRKLDEQKLEECFQFDATS
jgi:hypothetical protein